MAAGAKGSTAKTFVILVAVTAATVFIIRYASDNYPQANKLFY